MTNEELINEIEKLGTQSGDHWGRLREILKSMTITTPQPDFKKKK